MLHAYTVSNFNVSGVPQAWWVPLKVAEVAAFCFLVADAGYILLLLVKVDQLAFPPSAHPIHACQPGNHAVVERGRPCSLRP